VFPLVTRDGLREKARAVFDSLRLDFDATYDESGSIGRRYRRIDEIGTPFAVTVDYDTLKDDTVTLRSRDDMAQMRVPVHQLASLLTERLRPPAAVLESPRT
jgi:glycyl-tRNA synthetase